MIHSLCFSKALVLSSYKSIVLGTVPCYLETIQSLLFSNIKRVTFLTTKIQREALIRRQELKPKTTTESLVTQQTYTYSFMSKHIYIHSSDIETDAIILQINISSERVSCSCTLLSAVAQALTICNSLGLSMCIRQKRAETKRKD